MSTRRGEVEAVWGLTGIPAHFEFMTEATFGVDHFDRSFAECERFFHSCPRSAAMSECNFSLQRVKKQLRLKP
jgi:hypothetical protein